MTASSRPTLLILVASTRPGRVGIHIGQWVRECAEAYDGFDARFVDLAELALPFMDEPRHPKLGQYEHQHTRDWSATVAAADAFVFVTPEYNHGYNAVLKNALDFLHKEWANKPVGFVTYGGVAAGTRALQQLKPVVASLRMVPAVEAVNIPFVGSLFGEDGVLQPNALMGPAATAMFDELLRLEGLLRPARRTAELQPATS